MINARAETVAEKPTFRAAFRRQRCLIPADAFYEWQKVGATKVPYAVVRQDGQPMAFAGLWSIWHDKIQDQSIRSCTILTTAANAVVGPLHDRMPVILAEDTWTAWLDPRDEDVELLQSFLRPAPDELLRAYPVSRLVNDVHTDNRHLLDAV